MMHVEYSHSQPEKGRLSAYVEGPLQLLQCATTDQSEPKPEPQNGT